MARPNTRRLNKTKSRKQRVYSLSEFDAQATWSTKKILVDSGGFTKYGQNEQAIPQHLNTFEQDSQFTLSPLCNTLNPFEGNSLMSAPLEFNPYQKAANPVVAIVNTFNMNRLEAGLSTYAYEVSIKEDNIKDHDKALISKIESMGMISTAPFNLSVNDFQVFQSKDKENLDRLVIAKDLFTLNQSRLFVVYGSIQNNEEFENTIKAVIPKTSLITIRLISCDSDGDISSEIKKIDANKINQANKEFYPFEGFHALIDHPMEFVHSKQNLAILIGPPGTGKSTLLRSIISKIHHEFESVAICSSPMAYSQADFYTSVCRGDGRKLIILEDASTAISKREEGNVAMHELLNKLDGIIESNDKIIISTNLATLKCVDEAVYRPGRCYGVYQTKMLTPEQGNQARISVGLKPMEIKESMTLATVLNLHTAGNINHIKGQLSFT